MMVMSIIIIITITIIMQCNAMQCNAMQCNAMQCNAMQCNAMPSSLALVGIHALVHHHDADTSQVFASPASTPTHLDVLPTLHPPVPPHMHSHHTRDAAHPW